MTTKFTYDDIVRIRANANENFRPGQIAWVVGVFDNPDSEYFKQFPKGVIYTVEFENGDSLEIHESLLEPSEAS